MRHRPLLGCLLLSGYAAVAFELLWVRQLALVFGSTTGSFSTVLAVFFGGLALGSWLATLMLRRVTRPMRAYGIVELATALAAAIVAFALPHLGDLVVALHVDSGWQLLLTRFGLSAIVLLPASTMMGMTLPLACRALLKSDQDTGRGAAIIYGINTFGAFLGAYLTTYHLLGSIGVQAATFGTIALNLLAALIAIADDARAPIAVIPSPAPKVVAGREEPPPVPLLLTLLSGFSFIALEVVWSRVASIMLGGSVYGLGAVLISVLIGIAVGSGVAAMIFRTKVDLVLAFIATQTVQLLSLVVLFGALPIVAYELATLAELRGGLDPIHTQLIAIALVLAIPCAAAGASLPLLVRIMTGKAEEAGSALGRLYAFNTVGSIAGSLLTGLVLLPQYGSDVAIFAGLLTVALSVALAATQTMARRRAFGAAAICLAMAFTFNGIDVETLSLMRTAAGRSYATVKATAEADNATRIFFSEGETANVRVSRSAQGLGLTLNGLGQGGRDFLPPTAIFESLLVGTVPLLHVADAQNALVVGLGAGATVETLKNLGVTRVKAIELEPKVLTAVERLYPEAQSPMAMPGVEVDVDDARYALLLNSKNGGERFDVIASMPAHPWVASPIFTREFFTLAKANLKATGVFSTWFGIGTMDETALRSLFQAFTDVFDNYVVYHVAEVDAFYLVGSQSPLQVNETRLADLQGRPTLRQYSRLESAEFFPAHVFASGDVATPKSHFTPVNTDDSAYIELKAPLRHLRPLDAKALTSQFADAYLTPRMTNAGDVHAFLTRALQEKIEALPLLALGDPAPLVVASAEATLEGLAKGTLTTDEVAYFEGRLAYVREESARARAAFERVEKSSAFYAKAQIGLAKLEASAEAATARLAALPFGVDMAFAIAEFAPERLEKIAPAVSNQDSDEAWVVSVYAHQHPLNAEEKLRFSERVMPKLRSRNLSLGVAVIAAAVATRSELQPEENLLKGLEATRRTADAQQQLNRGSKAYKERRFADAAVTLERAVAATPGNLDALKKLFHSYRKLGDQAGLARTKRNLALLGKDDQWISALEVFLDRNDQLVDAEAAVQTNAAKATN